MTITRRPSHLGELLSLRQAMDRLFEDSFVRPGTWNGTTLESLALPVDVSMTADELVVEAQLPGIQPDDVDITIENGRLTIRGQSGAERSEEDGDFLVREIRRGTLTRSITLPTGLKPDDATAGFADGVLTLRIPKAEEVKPHQIRISPTAGSTNGKAPVASPEQSG